MPSGREIELIRNNESSSGTHDEVEGVDVMDFEDGKSEEFVNESMEKQ